MKDEDVLITEYRVTALGEGGQYIFDWVDEEANTVKFVPAESDFDDFDKEVENVLNRNGVSIVRENDNNNSENNNLNTTSTGGGNESNNTNIGQPDPIGSSTTETESQDSADDFKPVDNSNDSTNESESTMTESQTDKNLEPNNASQSNNTSSADGNEVFSFIVRMSDPSNRREVIKKIRDKHPKSADELELSGPFEVSYKVTGNGIELVAVEDLGTGSKVSSDE